MKKCWNSDPFKRPTIIDLEYIISQWLKCVNKYYDELNEGDSDIEFKHNIETSQFKDDIDEFVNANKTLSTLSQEQTDTSIIQQSHSQACYTSRLLNEMFGL
ncbi:hypothetical protein RclHR1_03220022 [Rhizophagus clarus]|uniref:Kinase-like domain-containing protein n=1 Tax=Rhizophagus clarus TaxID=94130 RepID=A0A2Z6RMQ0_9GLOM|nr:hypothetical protein RclHR1_03220022 [Rhizophagus clarus]GES95407.1 kinase-like domain-containing protein [Rhizophagus clarus]